MEAYNPAIEVLSRLIAIYVVIVITMVLNGVLLAIDHYYNRLEYSRTFPITSILQVVRAILYVLSAVIIISILFSIPAVYVLAAVGAVIAALTVVFNNLILAFIAGLILTSKKLIMIGDWIEIPELRINGEIQEITLTTVVVRNLDHTIGTVPSTYLLTNTFKNWRGVREEGARKIFWPVYFDVNSVKPVDQELLAEIASLPYGAEILRLWLNILYMLPLCILPFRAPLITRYGKDPTVIGMYGILLVAGAATRLGIWIYATGHSYLLIKPVDMRSRWAGFAIAAVPGAAYAIAIDIAKEAPTASLAIYAAGPVLYFLGIWLARTSEPPGSAEQDFT